MGTHPIFESDFDCLTEVTSVCVINREQSGLGSRLWPDEKKMDHIMENDDYCRKRDSCL